MMLLIFIRGAAHQYFIILFEMIPIVFIHSHVDQHLAHFYFGMTSHNSAMNTNMTVLRDTH